MDYMIQRAPRFGYSSTELLHVRISNAQDCERFAILHERGGNLYSAMGEWATCVDQLRLAMATASNSRNTATGVSIKDSLRRNADRAEANLMRLNRIIRAETGYVVKRLKP